MLHLVDDDVLMRNDALFVTNEQLVFWFFSLCWLRLNVWLCGRGWEIMTDNWSTTSPSSWLWTATGLRADHKWWIYLKLLEKTSKGLGASIGFTTLFFLSFEREKIGTDSVCGHHGSNCGSRFKDDGPLCGLREAYIGQVSPECSGQSMAH